MEEGRIAMARVVVAVCVAWLLCSSWKRAVRWYETDAWVVLDQMSVVVMVKEAGRGSEGRRL